MGHDARPLAAATALAVGAVAAMESPRSSRFLVAGAARMTGAREHADKLRAVRERVSRTVELYAHDLSTAGLDAYLTAIAADVALAEVNALAADNEQLQREREHSIKRECDLLERWSAAETRVAALTGALQVIAHTPYGKSFVRDIARAALDGTEEGTA